MSEIIESNAPNPYWDDEDEVLNTESFAIHPGPFLREHVFGKTLTASFIADRLNVARPGFNNMLNGKRPVTPALALKIEQAIGYPAEILCRMQAVYDLAHQRAEIGPDLALIERIARNVEQSVERLKEMGKLRRGNGRSMAA